VFYLVNIYNLFWGVGSVLAIVAIVSGPIFAHVDSSIANRSKSSLSHPSSGPFYMDDKNDFCQEDISNPKS
jgi:hypothetical protein